MSDRKYSQRGYQDDAPKERPSSPTGPRPEREGPKGRGLGRPGRAVFRCRVCGEARPSSEAVTPKTLCRKCGTALHTCTHCRHFDTSAPLECRLDPPERIPSKAKGNECPLFEPRLTQEVGGNRRGREPRPNAAKAAFDALFDF